MTAWKAFWKGLSDLRRTGATAGILYLATLVVSTLALRPLARGFHAALDGAPGASAFLQGRGLDLLAELAQADEGRFFMASMAGIGTFLMLFVPFALFLMAGAYGVAANREKPIFGTFGSRGVSLFIPFLVLFALNLLVLAACGLVAGLPIAGLFAVLPATSDPGPSWQAFLWCLPFAAIVGTLWRNSVGYAQAAQALDFPGGVGKVFLRGLGFSLRRLVPVNLMAWGVNALRIGAAATVLFAWRPGYATEGAWLASSLRLQGLCFVLAYLRAAEVRMQVAYMEAWPVPALAETPMAPPSAGEASDLATVPEGSATSSTEPAETPLEPSEAEAALPVSILI